MVAPQRIIELVEQFERNIDDYKKGKYNEMQVRQEFINPFFKELGWDVDNEQGHAELYKDVVHEDAVKIDKTVKAPDYSFRIGGQRKFFVEAKKPSVNIKDALDPAFQLRRYGWTAKLPLSILTDFEELAVYDCKLKPHKGDKPGKARIKYYTYNEYVEKWDEIKAVFSKEAIYKGAFDKYAAKGKKKGTQEVDDEFLKEIENWRNILAHNIALRNNGINQRQLNFSVQKIIDRIIFLRICEDRGIEHGERLKEASKAKNEVYSELKKLFIKADARFNSGLFHFKKENNRSSEPDELTTGLIIDDKPLKEIINHLYYPDSPCAFDVIPADILGQVYEQFLGKVIRLKGKSAVVEEKPEVKKAGGVFYTPTYIVDYIIENTLGKALEKKTPDQVEKIRVLDPACGSGSFLIQAYQYLIDWHLKWYLDDQQKQIKKREKEEKSGKFEFKRQQATRFKLKHQDKLITTTEGLELPFSERLRILKNNIYGVDIDFQAVEVTKLSLLLKLLEIKSHQLPLTQRILPDLDSNIKCGNSLIGTDFYNDVQLALTTDDEQFKINAFDWKDQFPTIFDDGGFDVVIGNPPYVLSRENLTINEKKYYEKNYSTLEDKPNKFLLFIEKGHTLLKTKGWYGYIIPNSWLTIDSATKSRNMIKSDLEIILDLNYQVFEKSKAKLEPVIFTLKKQNTSKKVNFGKLSSSFEFSKKSKELQSHTRKRINDDIKNRIFIHSNLSSTKLIDKIFSNSSPLKNHYEILSGLQAYERGKGIPAQSADDVTNRIYDRKERVSENCFKYLNGKDVGRYYLNWGENWLLYGDFLSQPRKIEQFSRKRILVREITSKYPYCINGVYIEDIYLNNKSIINILHDSDSKNELLFCLSIISSKLFSYFYANNAVKASRKIFPKLLIRNFRELPFPKSALITSQEKEKIVNLSETLLILSSSFPKTEQEKKLHRQKEDLLNKQIDQLVYQIYDLTPDEIALVENFGVKMKRVSYEII